MEVETVQCFFLKEPMYAVMEGIKTALMATK
jgi:hypothetical protein